MAAKSAILIISFSLVSKVLGFIREALIAAKFGSGVETDTFFIASSAITLFTTMITTSINNTAIPILSEIEYLEGKRGKRQHTSNLINIVSGVSFAIIIVAWLFAPSIVKLVAYGFEGEQLMQAIFLTRIGLPSIFLAGVLGIFRGYLQSELMFFESALTFIPVNLIYIFFLLFLSERYGINGLMIASVLTVVGQISIQIPSIKKTRYRHSLNIDIKDKYVKKIITLIPPILISSIVADFNMMIDRTLASTLVSGSISALKYSAILHGLVTSIFVSAIITVIFPILSQEANSDNYDGLKKVIIYGINIVLLITIPATVGIMVLSTPITRVAFERGGFDSNATYMTAGALFFYSIGLVATSIRPIIDRTFYSLQDTKTPMVNAFISLGVNLVFNLVLIRFMAHRGLALATSISAIVTTFFLINKLTKNLGSIDFLQTAKCGLKSIFASAAMGIVVYLLNKRLSGVYSSLLVCIGIGALIYSIIIYLFKITEVEWFLGLISSKLKRGKQN